MKVTLFGFLIFALLAQNNVCFASNTASSYQKSPHIDDKVLVVHSAWANALPPVTPNGAVYLTINNNSNNDDRLILASSPVAQQVTLHKTVVHHDHVTMEQQRFVELKAKQSFTFKPGSYHFMLLSLNTNLQSGKQFPLTLTFEKSGTIQVNVTVRNNLGEHSTPLTSHHH